MTFNPLLGADDVRRIADEAVQAALKALEPAPDEAKALSTESAAALVPDEAETPEDEGEDEAEETKDVTLVTFGSEVKALGGGRIGGYLVLFSDADAPDLTGDYFTKATDFGPHETSLVYYQHGQDGTLKRRVLDERASLKVDDVGVWVEAQLKMRDEYERQIERMVKAGKLGWSSGTAPHTVERVRAGKAAWVKTWNLGLDASLTPNPAEPRTRVLSLKALPPLEFEEGAALASVAEETAPMGDDTPVTTTQPGADIAPLAAEVKSLGATVQAIRGDLDDLRNAPAVKRAKTAEELGGSIGGGLSARANLEYDPTSRYHNLKMVSMPGRATATEEYPEAVFGGFCKALYRAMSPMPHIQKDAIKALDEMYGTSTDAPAAKALSTQAGVSGAYLIPEQFIPNLMAVAMQSDALYGKTMVIPVDGGEIVIPALDPSTSYAEGQSAYYGGVTVSWSNDDAAGTETEPKFKQIRLKTNAMKALTYVSNQLMQRSAIAIDSVVTQLVGGAIGRARDYSLFQGTGQGQPLGFLKAASALVDVGGSAIDFATLAGMEDHIIPERDSNYVWYVHSKSRSAMYQLYLANNTIVTFLPDLRGKPGMTFLGRPITYTDKLPWVANDVSNRVNLIDPSMIVVAEFQGIALAVSDQARFAQDQTAFRVITSLDAAPWLTNKIEVTSVPTYATGFVTL